MNYLPTCTSRLVVQHPCQVSFKSMQGCRRSWEDKLKCVKNLSVKEHNSAKICRTWIISPHALLDLWCNIPAKFHSNPCKDVGGVEKTNFDVTEGRNDGRKDKANTKCPLAILWRGHKNVKCFIAVINFFSICALDILSYNLHIQLNWYSTLSWNRVLARSFVMIVNFICMESFKLRGMAQECKASSEKLQNEKLFP